MHQSGILKITRYDSRSTVHPHNFSFVRSKSSISSLAIQTSPWCIAQKRPKTHAAVAAFRWRPTPLHELQLASSARGGVLLQLQIPLALRVRGVQVPPGRRVQVPEGALRVPVVWSLFCKYPAAWLEKSDTSDSWDLPMNHFGEALGICS